MKSKGKTLLHNMKINEELEEATSSVESMEKHVEIEALRNEIEDLKSENIKLTLILKESGIEGYDNKITDEEVACVKQINMLRKLSEGLLLDIDQTRQLDILVKTLKLIRGEQTKLGRRSKATKMTSEELAQQLAGNASESESN